MNEQGQCSTVLAEREGGLAGVKSAGELAPGTMVSEYRIERELGRGGMGVVYAALQPVIGKRVAIKILMASHARDPMLVRRFVEEARAVNRINHSSIVDIFGYGTLAGGQPYLIMEYLEGETLAQRLARDPISWRTSCCWLAQVASALEAAHGARVAHRDLKPENLWLSGSDADCAVKVLDFGVAKQMDVAVSALTAVGSVIGTPYYMAPEQCMGEAVDQRVDIYALGVILYRVSTGQLPFRGETFAQIVAQQVLGELKRPAAIAQLPDPLDALIMACLAKDPARRPSAAEVVCRLRQLAEDEPEFGSGVRLAPQRARWRVGIVLALLLGTVLAAALLLAWRGRLRAPAHTAASVPATAPRSASTPIDPPLRGPAALEESAGPPARVQAPRRNASGPARESDRSRSPSQPPSRAREHGLIEENPFR